MLQNRKQQTLFPQTIRSIGYDQINILQDIMTLYCPQGFECDPTFSKGNFYKSYIPKPLFYSDINPQVVGTIQADACHLPLQDKSISSILLDPPFLPQKTGSLGKIRKRFSSLGKKSWSGNMNEVYAIYAGMIQEAYRILQDTGILVFKCQDYTSFLFYPSHIKVYESAIQVGFEAIDLFILLAKSVSIRTDQQQRHARKYHSYFWVFQKKR